MIINDIMKYIESEFDIIRLTPCEVCGGEYFTEAQKLAIINEIPYDICSCVCSDCGYEKTFTFCAPFLESETFKKAKEIMN